jgi:RNA recognition motif-containing protein
MRLFVGNLPFKAQEQDLDGFFQSFGFAPDRVEVMRDRATGNSRGFGFVDFNDGASGSAAVAATNGKQLLGRAVIVNEARPMSKEGGGGGGGGRGGRGDRNRW